ncbi:MAG: hypothetical protein ACYC3S_06865 [Chloroflexota bacterium]
MNNALDLNAATREALLALISEQRTVISRGQVRDSQAVCADETGWREDGHNMITLPETRRTP